MVVSLLFLERSHFSYLVSQDIYVAEWNIYFTFRECVKRIERTFIDKTITAFPFMRVFFYQLMVKLANGL